MYFLEILGPFIQWEGECAEKADVGSKATLKQLDKDTEKDYLVFRPRQPRLDAPGALHPVIGRGIERIRIFKSDSDREDFLDRLATLYRDGHLRR